MTVLAFEKLEGWKTLQEVGDMLGVSRQDAERMVKRPGGFRREDVRTIGSGRPTYLVRTEAVEREIAESGDVTSELLAVV